MSNNSLIKINDDENVFSLTLNKNSLSSRKKHRLENIQKNYGINYMINYVESLSGKRRTALRGYVDAVEKKDKSIDNLKLRKPLHYSNLFANFVDIYNCPTTPRAIVSTILNQNSYSVINERYGEWLGVEIECIIPRIDTDLTFVSESDSAYCGRCDRTEENCDCHIENDNKVRHRVENFIQTKKIKFCRIKTDGSLRNDDEYCGLEFTILTRSKDLTNLKKLCDALKELSAVVDKTCGLHVHIDSRDDNGHSRAIKLKKFLPILNAIVPKSRLANQYCKYDTSSEANSRYAKINTEAIRKYSTVEVRLHSGTTDFLKISNWITILLSITNFSGRITEEISINNISYVARKLAWNNDTLTYVLLRSNKFNNNEASDSTLPIDVLNETTNTNDTNNNGFFGVYSSQPVSNLSNNTLNNFFNDNQPF